jgi:orotate phosphoribosyltransferase
MKMDGMKITEMTKEDILDNPEILFPCRLFSAKEVFHIAKVTGAFWQYDYKKTINDGVVGLHAELKSGLHSDAFFVSRVLLEERVLQKAFAEQFLILLLIAFNRNQAYEGLFARKKVKRPKWIAGIPTGATQLGKDLAEMMHVKNAEVIKKNGKIEVITSIPKGESLLLVEDFCTRGTGWKEAVSNLVKNQPEVEIVPFAPVILNRGKLEKIETEIGDFKIIPIVNHEISSWEPKDCPLCEMGSTAIKPKKTDENWQMITSSQK